MTFSKNNLRSFIAIMLPLLFLAGAIMAQLRYDTIAQEHFDLRAPVHRFATPAPIVRHLAFGFQNALADYYWVTAVQDYLKWDQHDTYYPEYFRTISTLDPKFAYPYMFAILTIPSRANPESLGWMSIIAEQGMRALPDNWQIPFYAGLQYHVIGKSYEQATHYLAIAIGKPDVPPSVKTTYAIYLMHDATEYQRSRALFTTIYDTTDNAETKQLAKERLDLLDVIDALEHVAAIYKSTYGVYPASLDDLSAKHLITLPPELIKKFPVVFDRSTGKVTLVR